MIRLYAIVSLIYVDLLNRWLNPVFGKRPSHIERACGQYDVPASDEADLLERRLDG